MSHTPIDPLLARSLPRSEGALSSRTRDRNSPFDQLFQQVNATQPASVPSLHASPAGTTQSWSESSQRRPGPQDAANSNARPAEDVARDEEVSGASSSQDDELAAEHQADDEPTEAVGSPVATAVHEEPVAAVDATVTEEPTTPLEKSREKSHGSARSLVRSTGDALKTEAELAGDSPTELESTSETVKSVLDNLMQGESAPVDGEGETANLTNAPSSREEAIDAFGDTRRSRSGHASSVNGDASGEPRSAEASSGALPVNASLPTGDQQNNTQPGGLSTSEVDAATAVDAAGSVPSVRSESGEAEGKSEANRKGAVHGKREVDAANQIQPAFVGRNLPPNPPVAATPQGVVETVDQHDAGTKEVPVQPRVGGDSKEGVLATFARFERSGGLAGHGQQHGVGSRDVSHVDPARFVSRVARAIQTAQDRGTPLLLRLNPPELGSLKLEMSVQQGALSATVEADNQAAMQLLLDNLPTLRERLAEQSIRIERFDVDVRRDGEGREQPKFDLQQQHDPNRNRQSSRVDTQRGIGNSTSTEAIAIVPDSISTTSINVVA
jgi:flagellar hook-length control protein FliK